MSKITFIKNNKSEYIETNPNLAKYRFDILYNDEYEILFVEEENNNIYIPLHVAVYNAYLGIDGTSLSESLLKELTVFIFRYYTNVDFIKIPNIKTIKRKSNSKYIKRALFQYGYDSCHSYLRFLGLKFKKKHKELLKINESTRCLMIAPHPDDEIIGAGGLLIKYSNNFDCICMGSSGVSEEGDMELAKQRSNIRIQEFNDVMDYIGIKNHWIFETCGTHLRYDNEMLAMLEDYCNVLDLKQYDYIFLPHPKDGHHEHRFVTNKLFRLIAQKQGINPNSKVVFYEVWADMKNPNVFLDMSKNGYLYSKYGSLNRHKWNSKLDLSGEQTLLDLKYKVLRMYKSQFLHDDIFIIQTMRKCVNNGNNPIWNFKVTDIKKVLK